MPRLSLEQRLDRQLALSTEQVRYSDFSAVVRRLHLGPANLPERTLLKDQWGNEWLAGEPTEDGLQPVATLIVGRSRKVAAGITLKCDRGEFVLQAETLLRVGGVWDNVRRTWRHLDDGSRDPGSGALVIDAMESQLAAVSWYRQRLAALQAGEQHPQSVGLLFDDRRGGKTFICVLFVILACLELPQINGSPLEARIITQTIPARDEIDEAFRIILPAGWAQFKEQPKRIWTFGNGAKILMLTGTKDESTLSGRMDVVFINEAALFKRSIYDQVLRATLDRRGFLLAATNKPKKPKGNWVTLLWEGAERDERDGVEPAVARLRVNPARNAAIDTTARGPIDRAILYARSEDDTDLDEGLIAEAGQKLFCPPWLEAKHVQPLPDLGYVDLTPELTRFAYGRAFEYLVGQDYQYQCAGSAWRVLAPGGDLARAQLWCVWAVWLYEDGDEDALLDEMEMSGFSAKNSLVIPDCSGGSQGGKHLHGIEPPSFERLRRRQYHWQEPVAKANPQSLHGRNPPVSTSLMRCRQWISEDRVYVVAGQSGAKMARAFAKCEAFMGRYGDLRAKGGWAHLIDTFRYPHWWLGRQLADREIPLSAEASRLTVDLRRRR